MTTNETTVTRPEGSTSKISFREEFELCYIRHRYIRRCTYNPTKAEMGPYKNAIVSVSMHSYSIYNYLFNLVGFKIDDLISIGHIHLVSFLNLFSMEKMPEKMEEFRRVFIKNNGVEPQAKDILSKNQAIFTMFLKQRTEDMIRICRQKARNIKGLPTEEFYVFCGTEQPPNIIDNLLENHEKYGYRKLAMSVFKSIRKQTPYKTDNVFKFNNKWYVCVPIRQKELSIEDLSGADLDPYANIHNMMPEEILDRKEWKAKENLFHNLPVKSKVLKIRNFIEKNKNNPMFKEEVSTARKLLKERTF